ncbi:MAG: molybdopterin dinucleotide-binding protein [Candidatus Bathyarchaeota archaeon]|nr:MAG: molybdopterin dinucleotide-binding protein [Candidatus Bathyarchaeota archaeon]
MQKLRVTLLTGRTIDQGTAKEHGKLSDIYLESVAICDMDPNDMKKLGIRENSNIKITTKHGEIIVKATESKRAPHSQIVYMPYGLWANILVNSATHGTGMPSFKGIKAEIQPAPTEKISNIPQLLKQTYNKGF